MFKINEDKLTPFDRQVINIARLTPDAWSLTAGSMKHPDFGGFKAGLWGWSRQLQLTHGNEGTKFRQLSWRGRIVLTREHRHMLQRVVSVGEESKPEEASPLQARLLDPLQDPSVRVEALRQLYVRGLAGSQPKP